MNRTALNLLVDVVSFFAFLASTISGLVLWQVLPGGEYGFRGGQGLVLEPLFWGLSHQDWLNLHNQTSLLLVALIVLHIALHWRWIMDRARKFGRAP